MKTKSKIAFGRWEATALLVNLISTQIFLGFPRIMAETAGPASWILILYVTGLALICFTIIARLYSGFEGMDLIDIGQYFGGSPGRVIVGSILLAYLLFIISLVLREFAEDMKAIALPVSPVSYVILYFMAGMIVGAYLGIEAIVRFCAIVVPIIIFGFLFIMLGVMPFYDLTSLLPIFGNGLETIFGSGSLRLSIYSAVALLFLLPPFIKTQKNLKKVGYLSIGISAVLFLISAVVYLIVFAYPTALEGFIPIYQLARLIDFGRFFERVESVFVLIWAASALIYLSAGFFFIVYVFKKTFKLEYYRPLIIPFAILIFALSFLPPNLMVTVELEGGFFRNYAWITSFLLPIVVLLLARFVKKRDKKEERKRV